MASNADAQLQLEALVYPVMYGWRVCCFVEAEGEGVDINGRTWRWEFSRQFGPVFIDKRNGDPLDVQPAEKSPAWPVFERWHSERRGEQR